MEKSLRPTMVLHLKWHFSAPSNSTTRRCRLKPSIRNSLLYFYLQNTI